MRRNQVRDYLDVAALAETTGPTAAARVLANIDEYYADQRGNGDGVAAQLVRQLADPRPRDASVTQQLPAYKGLNAQWHDWKVVREACQELARLITATAVSDAP